MDYTLRLICTLLFVHLCPKTYATPLGLRQILQNVPLLSLPQGGALESHCGTPDITRLLGDWPLPSECHQKLKLPEALSLTTPEQSALGPVLWIKLLRGLNSGFYFKHTKF